MSAQGSESQEGTKRHAEPSQKISGVIVDLGKRPRKQVEQLKAGQGYLVAEVLDCVDELRDEGKIAASAEPVIVLVERRPKDFCW